MPQKIRPILLGATIFLAWGLNAPAAEGSQDTNLIGHWDGFFGSYADVWAEGDYAYLAHNGFSNIDIVNISDPAVPVHVLRYELTAPNNTASAQDVKVGDGLLFIGMEAGGNAVHIVDIRDPENPVGLTDVAIAGFNSIHNVFYDNGFLYMADSDTTRVGIIDLTNFDPDNPPAGPITAATWILQNVGTSIVHDITVVDGRLYACAWNSGLWIYDVTDVANQAPVFLGSGPGTATHSAWPTADGKFVVTGEERLGGGITVYRIDPQEGGGVTLQITDQAALPTNDVFSVHNQVTVGYRVYNSWYQAGLQIYDIDPQSGLLSFVAAYDTDQTNSTWGVYPLLGPDRILISDISNGLFIVSLIAGNPDLNLDGNLNILDMIAIVDQLGPCAIPNDCPEDLNADGTIDLVDLGLLSACWPNL